MKRNISICLFSIILLAVYLRIHNLGLRCLWFDEALDIYYLWTSGLLFPSIASISPLYSIILYFWKGYATNEFMLRVPSVFFSLASVYVIYALSASIFDKKTGLIAALILAVSPFHVYYAQECRPYSLSCLLALLAVYYFVRGTKTEKAVYWIWFVFFTVLGVYTHYIVILLLLVENAFFLFNLKRYAGSIKKWVVANIVILAAVIPAIRVLCFSKYLYTNWWVPSAGWHSIPITLKNFSAGYNAPAPLYLFSAGLFILLFIYGAIKARKNEFFWLFIGCLFSPLSAVFIFSLVKPSYYIDRHFIVFSVFFYILAAYGASMIKRKSLFFITLACILGFSLTAIRNYYAGYLPNSFIHHIGVQEERDIRGAAGYIARNFSPGDLLCFADENAIPQFWYYLGQHYSGGEYNQGVFRGADRKLMLEYDKKRDRILCSVFFNPSRPYEHEPAVVSFNKYKRVWLVACYNEKRIVRALSKEFARNDLIKFKGVKVYLFVINTEG